MYQNIPNPFENITIIQYYLPRSVRSSHLEIHDLKGNLVHKSRRLKTGYGAEEVDLSSVTKGIYIYSLVIDSNRFASKQMVSE